MNLDLREKAEKFTTTLYPSTKNKLKKLSVKYKISQSKVIEYLVVTNYENLMKDRKEV
jgi:hypothetical protein